MKKIAVICVLLLNFGCLYSQNEVHIPGIPEKATVFLMGSILELNLNIKVKNGTNIVFIDSLPDNIDENSIRLNAGTSASVMSTDLIIKKVEKEELPEPEYILKIKDSIEYWNNIFKDLNNRILVFQSEESIINSYKLHPETEKGSSVQELTFLSNFYNRRINEIKSEILKIQIKQTEINLINNRLSKIHKEYRDTRKPVQNNHIIAIISCQTDGNINLNLNFYTESAGWLPIYEIRVKDITSPVILSYKANLWQKTGKDWKDIKLILSTRNPRMNNDIPVLNSWYLNYSTPKEYKPLNNKKDSVLSQNKTVNSQRNSISTIQSMRDGNINVQVTPSISSFESKYMNVEFKLSNKYSIKSDNRKQSITLNDVDVPAVYEYFSVPKIDPDAFLIAKISDWEKLDLLPGEAYIYFENTYIGNTMIDPEVTTDTLNLSLGRDKSIVIKRESIQDMTETKFLSSNVVKQYGYLITVRNNRKSDISITIQDQFPVSTHEKIEVELLESSGANINKEKGFLTWLLKVPSGKSIEKKLAFKIDSPNN